MKTTKNLILTLAILAVVPHLHAANIIFNFKNTTANGTDLFASAGGSLFTNASSPTAYFSLGFVNAGYDFTGKSRGDLLSAIGNNWISSSNSSWQALSTSGGTATGGKVNVSFNNSGNGYDTTALGWMGKMLVAVVSEGVNPLSFSSGVTFANSDNIAIVRANNTVWNSILATDASLSPTNQTLDVADFTVLVGTYTAIAGGWGTGANKYDTIAVVPEPSTGALLMLGAVGLVAMRRLRKA